ncbi:restriction endonuclease subunit S, partial [Peptostreptococcus stomatis]|uniref:restriction endonuclease subunit S n=1 Tax=Peptostreptococcus stomatis TaxID=341694 RepID=UPI0028D58499
TDRQAIIRLIQYVFGYTFVRLDEIATIIRGGNFQKKDFVEYGRPCIHYGQMYTHFGVYADKTLTFLNDEVFAKSKTAKPGDIVMAVTSENVEDVCSCTAWLGNEEIAISGHTAIISHNQNAKYMSYFFHSASFFEQKKRLAHGTKVIEVTPSKLGDIVIMLPTIEEQERIVSMLDRFDSLCNDIASGLPAEIEARQKQYEYYRDKLLSFE